MNTTDKFTEDELKVLFEPLIKLAAGNHIFATETFIENLKDLFTTHTKGEIIEMSESDEWRAIIDGCYISKTQEFTDKKL
jgi:hypothetical protein